MSEQLSVEQRQAIEARLAVLSVAVDSCAWTGPAETVDEARRAGYTVWSTVQVADVRQACADLRLLLDTLAAVETERGRLREALEWYADPGIYHRPFIVVNQQSTLAIAELDNGERARAALAGEGKEGV